MTMALNEVRTFECTPFSLPRLLHSLSVPSVAPTLGEVTRVSATKIQVSWGDTAEGEDLVDTYFVRYRPIDGVRRRRRNVEDTTVVVETNQTVYRISGLEPGLAYAVSVAAGNRAGRGSYSMETTAGRKLFAFKLTPMLGCT